MNTFYLDGNIEDFVNRIAEETKEGNNVAIKLPGCNTFFGATIYAWSSASAIRAAIISKLKAIKEYEQNVKCLEDIYPSALLDRFLAHATPDEVAELCFESGLVNVREPKSKRL